MTLSVELGEKVFEGEAGAYYQWNAASFPLLSEAKVGAGRLILHRQGFALPHFADSTKIGFVLQGTEGLAGLISPNSTEEKVVRLKKGDTLLIKAGSISWWFNGAAEGKGDNSLLDVVFVGETPDAQLPGQITYQFLAGANGLLRGFSNQFLSKAYHLSLHDVNHLANSQTGVLAIKLPNKANSDGESLRLEPNHENFNFLNINIEPDLQVQGGGYVTTFSPTSTRKIKSTCGCGEAADDDDDDRDEQLCAVYVKLEPNATFGPAYVSNPAVQGTYVAKGNCWAQVVDMSGQLVLDKQVEAGYLIVVPKFYVVSMAAGEQGVEIFTVMTCSRPVYGVLSSLLKSLDTSVLRAALNLSPEFEQITMPKVLNASLIVPPKI